MGVGFFRGAGVDGGTGRMDFGGGTGNVGKIVGYSLRNQLLRKPAFLPSEEVVAPYVLKINFLILILDGQSRNVINIQSVIV